LGAFVCPFSGADVPYFGINLLNIAVERYLCADKSFINTLRRSNLMADDAYYMRMALQEAARAAEEGEIPVGAVVVSRGNILAKTHNLTETLCDVTAHAEIQAITAAAARLGGKYLTECTLYVTLEPCVMCAGAIGWAQVGRLVYGAEDPKRGYHLLAPGALHPKTEVICGVMADDAAALVRDFFKKKRG
jgi:tRNA(adenine34) deaminase